MGGESGERRHGRIMKSRSVSCTLPALVAVALVTAGCGGPGKTPRPVKTTTAVTSTTRPGTSVTPSRPATTSSRPTAPKTGSPLGGTTSVQRGGLGGTDHSGSGGS
ncbi:hypothetical protein [Nocardia thailandica]|uniref:hypothetical protein n=1 Tax=Nocardia thailandica TaxID=257275 RepID=UPI0002DC76E0|nr:hypothetical protein [Nocardia thailandica]